MAIFHRFFNQLNKGVYRAFSQGSFSSPSSSCPSEKIRPVFGTGVNYVNPVKKNVDLIDSEILKDLSTSSSPSLVTQGIWLRSSPVVTGIMIPKPAIGIPVNYRNRINPITYEDKLKWRKPMEDPVPSKIIEEAPDAFKNSRIEKQAARLIVIRRIKMNKHKLRKLRKKMKHEWAKRKLRREIKKERAFLDSKLAQIREAEAFDAKEYVANLIAKAKQKEIPRRWNGKRMPAWWIKEQIALGKIKL
jgi:hypothetical protein